MAVAPRQAPAVAQPAPEPVPPPAPVPPAVPLPEAFGPNSFALPPVALQLKDVISEAQIQRFTETHRKRFRAPGVSKNEIQEAVELQLQQFQRDGVFRIPALRAR